MRKTWDSQLYVILRLTAEVEALGLRPGVCGSGTEGAAQMELFGTWAMAVIAACSREQEMGSGGYSRGVEEGSSSAWATPAPPLCPFVRK